MTSFGPKNQYHAKTQALRQVHLSLCPRLPKGLHRSCNEKPLATDDAPIDTWCVSKELQEEQRTVMSLWGSAREE